MSGYISTRWYRAPEIIFEDNLYSKEIDIWGVGCILAELILGKPLFPGKSTEDQLKIVCDLVGRPKKEELDQIFTKSTIPKVTKLGLKKRISFKTVFDADNLLLISFLKRCLHVNPNKRMSVDQALNHPYLQIFRDKASEIEMGEPMVLYDTSRECVDTIEERIYDLISIQSEDTASEKERLSEGIKKLVDNKIIQDPYKFRRKQDPVNNFFKNS